MVDKATLYNPEIGASSRTEVEVGSTQASDLFSKGYKLEQSFDPTTGISTMADSSVPKPIEVPDVISSDALSTTKDATLVSKPDAFNLDAFVSGLDKTTESTQDFINRLNIPSETLEAERTSLSTKLLSKLDEFTGRTERREELGTELDVTGQQKQLGELMTQLAGAKASYEKLITDEGGRAIPKAFVTGRQAQIQKQAAVELGGLAAMAQAVQGNITAANDLIDQTITAEYQPILDEINALKDQLAVNYDNLTLAEQKRADSMNILLEERTRIINQEEAMKVNIGNLAVQAAQNGAPNSVLQQMLKAGSYEKAIGLASGYLEVKPSISEQLDAAGMGYDIIGGQIVPENANTIASFSGHAYDMSTYAKDPAHAQAVQGYINRMGQFAGIGDIDAYIQSVNPESPITGQMIANASTQNGIGWEELTALMQHETAGFKSNVMINNNNPGGVTWSSTYQQSHPGVSKGTARPAAEGGNYVKFPTMQDGVNAVAEQLARRQVAMADTSAISEDAKFWANKIRNNEAKITDKNITEKGDAFVNEVNRALQSMPTASDKVITDLKSKVSNIDDLLDHKGMSRAVGAYPISRLTPFKIDKAAMKDFIGGVQQLISQETMNTLLALKKEGGTLGALSDQERIMLQNAASKIGNWYDEDKERYVISEKYFKKELESIQSLAQKALKEAGVDYTFSDDEMREIDALLPSGSAEEFAPENYF